MKTKITFLPVILMMSSSIFYSQDFNRVPAKTAVYDSLTELEWRSEPGLTSTTNDIGAVYFVKKSGVPSVLDTGFIYLIGEVGPYKHTSSISKYNTVTRIWSEPDSLPINPMYYKAAQLGGKIYMAGGKNGLATCICNVSTLYIYDIEKDSLWLGHDMLKELQSYAIGSYGDSLIYIMGGDEAMEGAQNFVQIYNIHTESWSYATPLSHKKSGMGGTIAGNKIILAGGSTNRPIDAVDIGVINPANPYEITWTTSEFPGGKLHNIISGSWYGKNYKYVYFTGGMDSSYNYKTSLWAYNIQTGQWSKGPDKKSPARCFSDLIPIVRNDSVFMVTLSRSDNSSVITNEWLFIGIDEPDTIYIGVHEEPNITAPKECSLSQNYPNPFNPSTKIKYSLREPGHVSLTVYDMLGREIKTLINELMSAGEHEVIFNAGELNLSSGIYLYRIKSGSFVQTKKLMLIK